MPFGGKGLLHFLQKKYFKRFLYSHQAWCASVSTPPECCRSRLSVTQQCRSERAHKGGRLMTRDNQVDLSCFTQYRSFQRVRNAFSLCSISMLCYKQGLGDAREDDSVVVLGQRAGYNEGPILAVFKLSSIFFSSSLPPSGDVGSCCTSHKISRLIIHKSPHQEQSCSCRHHNLPVLPCLGEAAQKPTLNNKCSRSTCKHTLGLSAPANPALMIPVPLSITTG